MDLNKLFEEAVSSAQKHSPINTSSRWYDRDGKPIDLMVAAKLFEDENYKIVAQDYTWYGALVSTVWLGLDHSIFYGDRPLIFETMVFFRKWHDIDMLRYSSEKEARAGHREMLWKWNNPFWLAGHILAWIYERIKSWFGRYN